MIDRLRCIDSFVFVEGFLRKFSLRVYGAIIYRAFQACREDNDKDAILIKYDLKQYIRLL